MADRETRRSALVYPLPRRPIPQPRETLFSFLSRFAAVNGASTKDFAIDLGYQLKRFLNFEDAARHRLSEAADLDSKALQTLISWTGKPIGDVRMAFCGEPFVSRAVRSPIVRGCPVCLREDAQTRPSNSISVMVMHGDWMLREVSVCCRHRHPLVPLWEYGKPTERYDIGQNLNVLESRIISGDLDRRSATPFAYDLWLDTRLETGQDPTWLASHGLYVVTTMCGLLGSSLIKDRDQITLEPSEQQFAAQAAGLALLSD